MDGGWNAGWPEAESFDGDDEAGTDEEDEEDNNSWFDSLDVMSRRRAGLASLVMQE